MSLLDQLWDDTLAGPRPETGLGKLRKQPTFSFRSASGKGFGAETDDGNAISRVDDATGERMRVTRSIMIVKPEGNANGSPLVSPAAGSTPPVSPFAGGRESYRFRRRSTSDAFEKANGVGPRSPSSTYNV